MDDDNMKTANLQLWIRCFHMAKIFLQKMLVKILYDKNNTTKSQFNTKQYKKYDKTFVYQRVGGNFTRHTMNIDDLDFHDSQILSVTENTQDHYLDFLLDFPTNWQDNTFEKRI